MTDFSEKRLNVKWGVGAVGGPEFSTVEVISASGFIYSNANWVYDVFSVDIGNRGIQKAEKDYLLAFFKNRKGKNQGFRFKNWSDYKGENEFFGFGDGTRIEYQLFKNYVAEGDFTSKKVSKPVVNTLTIKINNEPNFDWACDYTTGLITFISPPPNGAELFASFEYDLPVKFGVDKFELTFLMETAAAGHYQIGSLPIREVPV